MLKAIPIRVSATEIVLFTGLTRDSTYIRCDSVEECDEAWHELVALRRGELSEPRNPELAKLLREAKLLAPRTKPRIEVVGDGALAKLVAEALEQGGVELGPSDLKIVALDTWSPSKLRQIDAEARRGKYRVIPVFTAFDIGVIGPLTGPGLPGYTCLEHQLASSSSWLMRVAMDYVDSVERPEPNPVQLRFLADLTAVIAANEDVEGALSGRAVLVDFNNVFIDVVRVLLTPSCDPSLVVSGI